MKLTCRMVPFALIVVLFVVAGHVPATYADPASQATGLDFALIGDIPYGFDREPSYLNLIKDINQAKPAWLFATLREKVKESHAASWAPPCDFREWTGSDGSR